jgi:hypothetical protein
VCNETERERERDTLLCFAAPFFWLVARNLQMRGGEEGFQKCTTILHH